MRLLTSVVALVAGAALAVTLAGTRAGRAPQWLGTRTLEVYLLHGLLVGVLVRVGTLVHPGPLVAAAGVVLALVATGMAVSGSLAVARGLRAVGGGWLFVPPWHGRGGAERLELRGAVGHGGVAAPGPRQHAVPVPVARVDDQADREPDAEAHPGERREVRHQPEAGDACQDRQRR